MALNSIELKWPRSHQIQEQPFWSCECRSRSQLDFYSFKAAKHQPNLISSQQFKPGELWSFRDNRRNLCQSGLRLLQCSQYRQLEALDSVAVYNKARNYSWHTLNFPSQQRLCQSLSCRYILTSASGSYKQNSETAFIKILKKVA